MAGPRHGRRAQLAQEGAEGRDAGAGADHDDGRGRVGGQGEEGGADEDVRGRAGGQPLELGRADALLGARLCAAARLAQHLDGEVGAVRVGRRGGGDGVVARRQLWAQLEQRRPGRRAGREIVEELGDAAAVARDVRRVLLLAGGRGEVAQPGGRRPVGARVGEHQQQPLRRGRAHVRVVAEGLLDRARRRERRRGPARRRRARPQREGGGRREAEPAGQLCGEGGAVVGADGEVVGGGVGARRPSAGASAAGKVELEVAHRAVLRQGGELAVGRDAQLVEAVLGLAAREEGEGGGRHGRVATQPLRLKLRRRSREREGRAAAAAAAAEGLNVLGGRPAAGGAALRVARERAGGLTAGGLKAGGLKAGGLEPERWWKAAVRKAAQQADWGGGGLEGGKRGEAAACADLVKADRLQRRELPDRGAGTDRRGGCVGHRR
mmetsp:Transcript_23558/g.70385  ORF Transcript_23558/g.70385 Transcript_23558/m.70385 type:complete len:437 (+) Transcript_23558:553-1863(+)